MKLTLTCPKCGEPIRVVDLRHRFSPQGRRGKKPCPNCGAWLECANAYQISMLFGLILGLVVGSSQFWGISSAWIRLAVALAVAVVLGLTIAPFLVSRFGRLQVLANGFRDSAEVKKWSRVMIVSSFIGAAAVLLVSLSIPLQAIALVERVNSAQSAQGIDALILRSFWAMGLSLATGLAVGLVAIWIGLRAARRRSEARSAENRTHVT